MASSKHLRLASFDAGGAQSFSQLEIMSHIMHQLKWDKYRGDSERIMRPCEYFDLIGGSDTGGLIAIMLVKLRMTVEEATDEFATIVEAVYANKLEPAEKSKKLRECMEELLTKRGLPVDLKLQDEKLDEHCLGFVLAANGATIQNKVFLRTYPGRYPSTSITVIEAVLATCASQPEFLPVVVGSGFRQQEYVGPGHGASNPIRQVLAEAQKHFEGDPLITLLLSLGSGKPAIISLPRDGGSDAVYPLAEMRAVECEEMARGFQEYVDKGVYFRFSVEQGMQRDLDANVDELGWIVTQTEVYLAYPETAKKIEDCVRSMSTGVLKISLSMLSRIDGLVLGPAAITSGTIYMDSAQRDDSPSTSSWNMDLDSFAGSPHQSFDEVDPYEEPYIGGRPVKVLLCGKTEIEGLTFQATPASTFGDLEQNIAAILRTQVTALQANYGHRTFWNIPDATTLIGNTRQILHVVVNRSEPFILGVVRTPQSEYPISIFNTKDGSTTTVSQAIFTAQPDLEHAIKTIEDFEHPSDDVDIRQPFDFTMVAENKASSPAFPTVLFITKNGVLDELLHERSPESIPPFLQLPFAHYKCIFEKASQLGISLPQLNYLLRGALHIIISFANALDILFNEETPDLDVAVEADDRLETLLPVVPALTTELKEILHRIEKIVKDLQENEGLEQGGNQETIKKNIDTEFALLCGDFPGAVIIRQSYTESRAMGPLDEKRIRGIFEDVNKPSRPNMEAPWHRLSNQGSTGVFERAPIEDAVHTFSSPAPPEVRSKPKNQLKQVKTVHSVPNQARIAALCDQEQKTVAVDGGNTVSSQLSVLSCIEGLSSIGGTNRIWTEGELVGRDKKRRTVYHCNQQDCIHQDFTAQKARQHFVACHVEGAGWVCPIESCTHTRKHKRLDDLKNYHMVPEHDTKYHRGRESSERLSNSLATLGTTPSPYASPASNSRTQDQQIDPHRTITGGTTRSARNAHRHAGPLNMNLRPRRNATTHASNVLHSSRTQSPTPEELNYQRIVDANAFSLSIAPIEGISRSTPILAGDLHPSSNEPPSAFSPNPSYRSLFNNPTGRQASGLPQARYPPSERTFNWYDMEGSSPATHASVSPHYAQPGTHVSSQSQAFSTQYPYDEEVARMQRRDGQPGHDPPVQDALTNQTHDSSPFLPVLGSPYDQWPRQQQLMAYGGAPGTSSHLHLLPPHVEPPRNYAASGNALQLHAHPWTSYPLDGRNAHDYGQPSMSYESPRRPPDTNTSIHGNYGYLPDQIQSPSYGAFPFPSPQAATSPNRVDERPSHDDSNLSPDRDNFGDHEPRPEDHQSQN